MAGDAVSLGSGQSAGAWEENFTINCLGLLAPLEPCLGTRWIAGRVKAGVTEEYVFSNTQDPNNLTVILKMKDLQTAKAWMENPLLDEQMKASGVVGKLEITYLNRVV